MEQKPTSFGWSRFVRLIRDTRPSPMLLGVALVLSLGATLAGLTIPLFTKQLVDQFSLAALSPWQIAGMGAAFILQAVAGGVSLYLLNRAGQQVVAALRDRLWRKLLHLPVPYYNSQETGETISRMTNDTGVVKALITEHLSGFITGIISIVGSIALLLYLDWRLTLLMLVVLPLSMLVFIPLGRKMYLISRELQDETARFTAVLTRVLSEIRLVKASNAEPVEYGSGDRGIRNLLRVGLREGTVQALIAPVMYFVLMILLVTIIGYGGMRVSSGDLTSGDLVAFILYLVQIIMPLTQVSQFFTQAQKAMGATERIVSVLEEPEEQLDAGQPISDSDLAQPLELRQVSFAYETGEAVLQDVSFTIEPGKVTAIVGPSGGGKTTIFSLLERFYRPQRGALLLDGRPVDELTLHSWRSRIGYVSQESPLVAGTIRDNLTYGSERTYTESELDEAVRMAYADEFIAKLPAGYDTEVGERGIKLSGGQRQRIAIARALLRNPQLLMLDEATSSLDSKSEIVVQQALHNLMRGRTTVVIAHRLSTVVDADRIVFIERGRVTGLGNHAQLYETHPMYREFADQQLRIQAVR